MKIVFASSEVAPFAKTGGLGDVVGSLPKALKKSGQDCVIIMPRYNGIDEKKFNLVKTDINITIQICNSDVSAGIYTAVLDGDIPVYFVDNQAFFFRDGLYETDGNEYRDNAERFSFFSRVCLELLKKLDIQPDVIHCNDWQTGLIPLYLKIFYGDDDFYKKAKTVFTIHNIAYQGLFDFHFLETLAIPADRFVQDGVEFYGKISFIKSGIVYSDIITTVSMTYAKEIQTKESGCGFDGLLTSRRDSLNGIINGIDNVEWNPVTDKFIVEQFSAENLSGKVDCKNDVLKLFDLKYKNGVPLIGIVSRLDEQKGFDLLQEIIDDLMHLDIHICILGLGKDKYHEFFRNTEKRFKDKMGVRIAFDNALAHKIEAGADMLFMPSKYEPCGMNQLYSLRYGTIPVVRSTGGLADTIYEYDPVSGQGNGFKFFSFSGAEFLESIKKAVSLYRKKDEWLKLVKNAMSYDYSWHNSAEKYLELYQKLKNED